MVKIDLITGFLGSGKTTFIKRYAEYLMEKGLRIGILENDFGAVNVDMLLLQQLEGEQCGLEMISGGCDRETHRRRFRTKLIAMGMSGYDRVLVEPSGIYEVDEFFDVLMDEPLDEWYEIGNVIAIVDAGLQSNLSKEAEYLLASEVADAGAVVLSHADEATPDNIQDTIQHLNRALESIQCKRRLQNEILQKSTPQLSKEDFDGLFTSGYVTESYQKMDLQENKDFSSLYFMNLEITKERLLHIVFRIMDCPECGNVFRIKGFLKDSDGTWLQLNATQEKTELEPIKTGQEVLIIIGEKLNEEKLNELIYEQEPKEQ